MFVYTKWFGFINLALVTGYLLHTGLEEDSCCLKGKLLRNVLSIEIPAFTTEQQEECQECRKDIEGAIARLAALRDRELRLPIKYDAEQRRAIEKQHCEKVLTEVRMPFIRDVLFYWLDCLGDTVGENLNLSMVSHLERYSLLQIINAVFLNQETSIKFDITLGRELFDLFTSQMSTEETLSQFLKEYWKARGYQDFCESIINFIWHPLDPFVDFGLVFDGALLKILTTSTSYSDSHMFISPELLVAAESEVCWIFSSFYFGTSGLRKAASHLDATRIIQYLLLELRMKLLDFIFNLENFKDRRWRDCVLHNWYVQKHGTFNTAMKILNQEFARFIKKLSSISTKT